MKYLLCYTFIHYWNTNSFGSSVVLALPVNGVLHCRFPGETWLGGKVSWERLVLQMAVYDHFFYRLLSLYTHKCDSLHWKYSIYLRTFCVLSYTPLTFFFFLICACPMDFSYCRLTVHLVFNKAGPPLLFFIDFFLMGKYT